MIFNLGDIVNTRYGPVEIIEVNNRRSVSVRFIDTGSVVIARKERVSRGVIEDPVKPFIPWPKIKKGDRFISSDGYEAVVVEYKTATDILIMFLDDHFHKMKVQASSLRRGEFSNPFHRSVAGVGYYGAGGHKASIKGRPCPVFVLWSSMINRCYNQKALLHRPSYLLVQVCERWHNLSNFHEDLPKIEGYSSWVSNPKEYQLDKDIKDPNSKIYDLDSCKFVTLSENTIDANRRRWDA